MSEPAETITCVECGGSAHLISYLPTDEPLEAGSSIAYLCPDCNERFDVVWEEDGD